LATIDDIAVLTSENVRLNYTLAGLGSRFTAFLADTLIVVLLLLAVTFLFITTGLELAFLTGGTGAGFSILEALYIVAVTTIYWGYYFFFEWINWGQTPGKHMLGIRVSAADGAPAEIVACAVRNVIRMIDLVLAGFGVTVFIMIFTPRYQRLGDLAAGTVVIKTRRLAFDDVLTVARDLDRNRTHTSERAAATVARATNDTLNGTLRIRIDDAEKILIQRYLERRESLPENVRRKLRADLARRLRKKVPASAVADLSDEQLIETAYAGAQQGNRS